MKRRWRALVCVFSLGAMAACGSYEQQASLFAQEVAIVLDGAAPATTLTPAQVARWLPAAAKTRADAKALGAK